MMSFVQNFFKTTLFSFCLFYSYFFTDNAWLNHTLTCEPYEKKGKQYLRIKDYKVTILPEKMTFNFENLFNGDKRLGDEINKVINENWEAIFNDVRSSYEESFGLIFKDLGNRVFSRVPYNELFIF